MEGGRKRLSCLARNGGAAGRGRKSRRPLRGQERDRAQRDRHSVRPAISRTQVGVPVAKTPGMKTGDRPSASPSNRVAAARHPAPASDKAVSRRTHAHQERAVPCSTSPVETWCPCANRWRRETRHPVTRTQSDCWTPPPPRIVGECRDRSDLAPTDVTDRRVLRRKAGPSASDPERTASTGPGHEDADRPRRDGSRE